MNKPSAKRFDIVAIGEAMVEFNQTRAGEPHYLQGFGGDTSNTMIAASRLGASTAYVTRLGDDEFGRMLLDLWRREGVDTDAVSIDGNAPTGVYFVNHGANGHVFSYLRAGSAASRMRADRLPLESIRSAKYCSSWMMPQMISRRSHARAMAIASAVPLSGWMRPNATRWSPGSAPNGNALGSMP